MYFIHVSLLALPVGQRQLIGRERGPEKIRTWIPVAGLSQSQLVAGSFLGTYLGQAVGLYRPGEPAGFIVSILGAIILLLL